MTNNDSKHIICLFDFSTLEVLARGYSPSLAHYIFFSNPHTLSTIIQLFFKSYRLYPFFIYLTPP